MIDELRPKLPDLEVVAVAGGDRRAGTVSLDEMVWGDEPPAAATLSPLGANDVMRMAFTSGTTGNPKGVTHSHNTTLPTCRTLNADMGVTGDEVFLVYLPLGLNWGYLTLVQAVLAGARAVLLDQFSAGAALELIQRERVTFIPTAPASIIAMLNDPGLGSVDLSSLRVVITGGASCPLETIREYRARMRGHLVELYGMLETGFHTYTRLTDDPERVTGTVGKPASGMGLRLIDEQGRDVPAGAEGEIAAQGPSVHLGYHNNPAANAELFTADGWFRTGDLGQLDAAGNLRIVRHPERAVREYGFRGAHIHAFGFGVPINDAMFYPYYARCAELRVPVVVQGGHAVNMMPSAMGRPILLDDVALYFPELTLVGAQTGWPWVEEMIALAWKHPNVYLGASGHAPRYWDPSLVRFINSRGQDKCVWGTDYPLLHHAETLAQIDGLDLKPDARRKLLHDNAARIFGLDGAR